MKISGLAITVVGLIMALGMGIPGIATATPPKIYKQARALPTRSGNHVKIVVFTNGIKSVKVSVGNEPRTKAERFASGCGKLRCEKWRVYAKRTGRECYDITIAGRRGKGVTTMDYTVCVPFRNGEI